MTAEAYVAIYGESYRQLITHSLAWLDGAEPKWKLDRPIDRGAFLVNLISDAKRAERVPNNGGAVP